MSARVLDEDFQELFSLCWTLNFGGLTQKYGRGSQYRHFAVKWVTLPYLYFMSLSLLDD